jgi:hypothetical protein
MSLKQSYNGIPAAEIKQFLEEKYLQYNNPSFIPFDPVSIPHSFTHRHDIEISGFLFALYFFPLPMLQEVKNISPM